MKERPILFSGEPHLLDFESRALWHLELLGCYEPDDAIAPWVPQTFVDEYYDDYEDYDCDDLSCTHCGGDGFMTDLDVFWDDCDWTGYGPCTSCRGTGSRKHQWVF